MDRETVNAPSRHPIDLPRFSSLKGALRAPKLPTRLGPYEFTGVSGATALQVRKRGFTMLKLIAILPVIVLLSGCHTSYELGTRRYQVTDDFSDAQFAVMQQEVDKLCELTDDCISITRESHWNKIYVGRISSECSEIGGCYAEFTDRSRELSITPESIEMGHLAQTFRHELGHAAGCYGPVDGNLAEPNNVMYGQIEDIAWTDADLDCVEGIR